MISQRLHQQLRAFADARDWGKFHNPKNLAMALAAECGELLAVFQWLTPEQAAALTPDQRDAAVDELADVTSYLLLLARALNVDVGAAVQAKLQRNEQRYPLHRSRGRADGRIDA